MLVRISRRLPHHTQPHFKMADHLSLVTAFWSRASVGRSAKVTCHLREINMELPHRVQKGLWANPKCPNTGMNALADAAVGRKAGRRDVPGVHAAPDRNELGADPMKFAPIDPSPSRTR
jgi:hypothetical protein